jgi:hypothetical protein
VLGVADLRDGGAQRRVLREVERDRDRRELREVADQQRRLRDADLRDARQWHLAGAAGLARQVQIADRLHGGYRLRLRHENHAILVGLLEDGRDDALAERVVQRVVDRGCRDAVARGKLPVHFDVHAQAVGVQIARDVRDRGNLLHARNQCGHVLIEGLLVRPAQHEVVLVARDRRVERQILLGLQIKADAGHVGDFLLDAAADFFGRERAVVARAQIDQEPAVVQRRIGAVDADVRGQRHHVGILQNRVGQRALTPDHGSVRNRVVGHADALNHADVLHRE